MIRPRISATEGMSAILRVRQRLTDLDPFVRFAKRRTAHIGTEPGKESGRGHDQRHMTVPAVPGSGLAVVEAEIILRALETFLNRPAQTCRTRQFCKGGVCRRKDQIIAHRIWVGAAFADQHVTGKARAPQRRAKICAPNRKAAVLWHLRPPAMPAMRHRVNRPPCLGGRFAVGLRLSATAMFD